MDMLDMEKSSSRRWFKRKKKEVIDEPALFPEVQKPKRKRWGKLVLGLLVLIILGIGIGGFSAWQKIQAFEREAQVSVKELWGELQVARRSDLPPEGVNLLVFGIDEVEKQREGSLLTDTIMIINIDGTGGIDIVSIPRDLWIDSLKTKINALYYYGEISEETTGVDLLTGVINDITGLKIDYQVQLNLELVRHIIDEMGGINVNVPEGFVDEKFPREGVDITSQDPEVLYERVEFKAGLQRMNGTEALKYIRSRQSNDLAQGNDLARNQRQQLIINSLINELKQRDWLSEVGLAGKLFRVFTKEVPHNIPLSTMIKIALIAWNNEMIIQTHTIPARELGQEAGEGIIYHPPVEKYKQWVYEPVDSTWQELRQFMGRLESQ